MSRMHWFKFDTGKWMNDPALRACSAAARGLWIDLLSLMSESPHRGYLEVAPGQPYSHDQIARMTGMSADEVSRNLSELVTLKVPSRTRKGILFSRKMSRDEKQRGEWRDRQAKHRSAKKAKKRKDNGHVNVTRDNPSDNHRDIFSDNVTMSRVDIDIENDISVTRDVSTLNVTSPHPYPAPQGAGCEDPPEELSRPNGADAALARVEDAAAALAPASPSLPDRVEQLLNDFVRTHNLDQLQKVTHDNSADVDQRSTETGRKNAQNKTAK